MDWGLDVKDYCTKEPREREKRFILEFLHINGYWNNSVLQPNNGNLMHSACLWLGVVCLNLPPELAPDFQIYSTVKGNSINLSSFIQL